MTILQKLNPLWWIKNEDDPIVPVWFKSPVSWISNQSYWMYLRNPLHNFTNYVIGIRDISKKKRYGIKPEDVFNSEGGFNLTFFLYIPDLFQSILLTILFLLTLTFSSVFFGILFLLMIFRPFVSWIGKYKFYIGWREAGALGIKLTNLK